MNNVNYKIEEYSDQYKDQIIDHIGNVLVYVGIYPKEALPIDDEDLSIIQLSNMQHCRLFDCRVNNPVIK